jgi:hypothetical protein
MLEGIMKDLGTADPKSISPQEITLKLHVIFNLCCGDYPGAVAVRHSFITYQKMVQSDMRDWKELGIQEQSAISGGSRNPLNLSSSPERLSESSAKTIQGSHIDPSHEYIPRLVNEAPKEMEKNWNQGESDQSA